MAEVGAGCRDDEHSCYPTKLINLGAAPFAEGTADNFLTHVISLPVASVLRPSVGALFLQVVPTLTPSVPPALVPASMGTIADALGLC